MHNKYVIIWFAVIDMTWKENGMPCNNTGDAGDRVSSHKSGRKGFWELYGKTSPTLIHIEEYANLWYLSAVDLGEFYIGVNANKRSERTQSRRCGFAPFSAHGMAEAFVTDIRTRFFKRIACCENQGRRQRKLTCRSSMIIICRWYAPNTIRRRSMGPDIQYVAFLMKVTRYRLQ